MYPPRRLLFTLSNSMQHEHHHVFWIRFRSNDEKDYFKSQDPAYLAFQKDVEPFVEKYTILNYDDDKDEAT